MISNFQFGEGLLGYMFLVLGLFGGCGALESLLQKVFFVTWACIPSMNSKPKRGLNPSRPLGEDPHSLLSNIVLIKDNKCPRV